MNLTKLRKEMKHMASELTERLQYSPELYKIRFDIEDGRYTMWGPDGKMMLDYDMDLRNRESQPRLVLFMDGHQYTASIFNKKEWFYKSEIWQQYEDSNWDEFKEAYNKLSYENQI